MRNMVLDFLTEFFFFFYANSSSNVDCLKMEFRLQIYLITFRMGLTDRIFENVWQNTFAPLSSRLYSAS